MANTQQDKQQELLRGLQEASELGLKTSRRESEIATIERRLKQAKDSLCDIRAQTQVVETRNTVSYGLQGIVSSS